MARSKAPADPQPLGHTADQLERKLAAEAFKKVVAGQKLTAREQAALKRYEKDRDEKLRWQHYRSIPQKHWRQMLGRQTKVINEQICDPSRK